MSIVEAVFCVKDLGDSITELFTAAARNKGVGLECDIDPSLPARLIGDETRVRQILFNLVGNALKFTDKGHVRVRMVPLSPGKKGDVRVMITVSDTGIGIPDERLADLFKPFVQLDGSYTRSHQGAGLGLAIVKRIVDLMGGNIAVESVPGEGTAVHVVLPFRLPAEEQSSAGRGVAVEQAGTGRGLRILLAEDEPVQALAMRLLLENAGHTVTLAEDGREVLDLFNSQDFDCILMDVQMPAMDGVEATRIIRSQEAEFRSPEFESASQKPKDTAGTPNPLTSDLSPRTARRIPIIALTAYAMTGDREKFLGAGMDDYLAKPVKIKELTQVLERVIRK